MQMVRIFDRIYLNVNQIVAVDFSIKPKEASVTDHHQSYLELRVTLVQNYLVGGYCY